MRFSKHALSDLTPIFQTDKKSAFKPGKRQSLHIRTHNMGITARVIIIIVAKYKSAIIYVWLSFNYFWAIFFRAVCAIFVVLRLVEIGIRTRPQIKFLCSGVSDIWQFHYIIKGIAEEGRNNYFTN